MKNLNVKRFIWKNRYAIGMSFALLFMMISGDSFATPNDGSQGSPPSGGGGKSSVPAPFGVLFLSMGALCSSTLKRYVPSFRVQDILILGVIATSLVAQFIDLHSALLFALPILGLSLSQRINKTENRNRSWMLWGGCVLTLGLLLPQWFALSLFAMVIYAVVASEVPRMTKIVLALATASVLMTQQPFVAPFDLSLQENFAYLACALLQLFGLPVVQEGHQIIGLATTINVTQACVGTSVIANTIALCAFVSVLFIPAQKQFRACIQMIGVILCLNIIRIAVITYCGNFYFQSTLANIHDYLGLSLALGTYLFVGAYVSWHWHKSQQGREI